MMRGLVLSALCLALSTEALAFTTQPLSWSPVSARSPKAAVSSRSRLHAPLAPVAQRVAQAPLGLRMAEEAKEAPAAKAEKSVLILSWFYAQPKELELVRRIYKKKGYTDIVIHESLVPMIAKPRGWYKTYLSYAKGTAEVDELREKLGRKFDVVHCMSGGFLNLALILYSNTPLEFPHLVMDSTPIMPTPKAFVRFARAYIKDRGLGWVNKVIPEPVQTGYQVARWSSGAAYMRAKHKILGTKRLGDLPEELITEMDEWIRWSSHNAMANRYEPMADDAIEKIFSNKGLECCTFLYNPEDPYINTDDVDKCIEVAKKCGNEIQLAHSKNNHIETLFRKPNLLFDSLAKFDAKEKAAA